MFSTNEVMEEMWKKTDQFYGNLLNKRFHYSSVICRLSIHNISIIYLSKKIRKRVE